MYLIVNELLIGVLFTCTCTIDDGISFHHTLTFLHLCLFVIICMQGFIQKEKVRINCQKVAQVSILANKVATQ